MQHCTDRDPLVCRSITIKFPAPSILPYLVFMVSKSGRVTDTTASASKIGPPFVLTNFVQNQSQTLLRCARNCPGAPLRPNSSNSDASIWRRPLVAIGRRVSGILEWRTISTAAGSLKTFAS